MEDTLLNSQLAMMKAAFQAASYPSFEQRLSNLKRLEQGLLSWQDRLIAAMQADFGQRSDLECRTNDITMSLADIRSAQRHLRKWMRSRRYNVPRFLLPARARVVPQPLGVVGIIAPWNFPVFLVISPLVPALAAGNRVMIKPSELTPATSQALAQMLAECFDPQEVFVMNGGAEVAQAFSALPFDHLLFTGSTSIGRKVALAAAQNLTPVTLELGGKSPSILASDADINLAARRIIWGKCLNAGQICVSPDYVLVPEAEMQEFINRCLYWINHFHPDLARNTDYTAMISPRHLARIEDMLAEARAAGTRIERTSQTAAKGCVPPTLVINPSPDLQLMREEIFGPLLPVIPYKSRAEARDFVTSRDRPLALYLFSRDRDEINFWQQQSHAGGMCINETVFHVAAETLPFGGIGASGQGAYHGLRGFETFSHLKPVFIQSRLNGAWLLEPPRRKAAEVMARLLQKLV